MNDNKKIGKNTAVLYISLMLHTFLGLFISRILLIELGLSDFGLYAVVGSVISLMNFISTSMLATTYRFIAIEIGKKEKGNLNKVFNTSLMIHISLAISIIIIGEIVGLWYVKNHLNINLEKISDAVFILHLTVLTTAVTVIGIPYKGIITAKEKFKARVSIELLSLVIKFIFILFLSHYAGNKLRAYAVIITFTSVIPVILFYFYEKYKEKDFIKWSFNKNFNDYKEMITFSFWILLGTVAYVGVRQGAALLINSFFGTVLNAAFGLATQINNQVMNIVKNLNQAAVPQIMKTQSSGNHIRSTKLVYAISKYSFFLMLVTSFPLLLSIDSILSIWLKTVPPYTKEFTLLLIIQAMIGVTSSGFDAAIQATGKIKGIQIAYSIILLITLPLTYILYKLSYPPYSNTILLIISTLVYRYFQILYLNKYTNFSRKEYLKSTVYPTSFVTLVLMPLFLVRKFISYDISGVIFTTFLSILIVIIVVYYIGLNRNEKIVIKKYVNKGIKKIKKMVNK